MWAYIWHAGVHAAEVAAGLQRIGFEIVSLARWERFMGKSAEQVDG